MSKRYVQRVEEICVGPSKSSAGGGGHASGGGAISRKEKSKNALLKYISDRELPGRKASTPGELAYFAPIMRMCSAGRYS